MSTGTHTDESVAAALWRAWLAGTPELEQLQRQLAGHRRIPCRGDDADLWTSDRGADRAEAARRCNRCPLLDECRRAADATRVRFGVWAGHDRATRQEQR